MAHIGCPGGPFMMTQVVLGTTCVGGPVNSLQACAGEFPRANEIVALPRAQSYD